MLNLKQCKVNWGQFISASFNNLPPNFLAPNFWPLFFLSPNFLAPNFFSLLIFWPLLFGPLIFWPQFLCVWGGGKNSKLYMNLRIFKLNVGLATAKLSSGFCQLCLIYYLLQKKTIKSRSPITSALADLPVFNVILGRLFVQLIFAGIDGQCFS